VSARRRLLQLRFWAGAAALVAAFGAVAGCGGGPSWKKTKFTPVNLARESAPEIQVPSSLWDKLEEIGREPDKAKGAKASSPKDARANEAAGADAAANEAATGDAAGKEAARAESVGKEAGEAKKEGSEKGAVAVSRPRYTEFAPIKAFLYEKTEGTLSSGAVELDFGQGGGELDFARYLSGRRGSFYLAVEPAEALVDEPFKAYFLSGAPETPIGGRKHGSGCGVFYDVTSFFRKSMSGAGILVNTTEMRHAFALGGTLFVGYAKGSKLLVAQLTMRDSRAPAAACRQEAKKP
jgi:hypothetical protein